MNPRLRAWVADRIARTRRTPPPSDLPAAAMAAELKEIGQLNLGYLLTPAQCAEVRDFFAARPAEDQYHPERPAFDPLGPDRDPNCHVANHRDEDIIAAPYLMELANDPRVVEVLHQYFGCRPLISYLGVWWSYPTPLAPQQAENFHRDVDDWRFIKLFVYLTDVGPDSGPHVYVKASADARAALRIRRYGDDEVADMFGRQAITAQISRAGTAFLENTFGVHKGQQPSGGTRLIFQVVYSLSPLPYGPVAPVGRFAERLYGTGANAEMNRIYLA